MFGPAFSFADCKLCATAAAVHAGPTSSALGAGKSLERASCRGLADCNLHFVLRTYMMVGLATNSRKTPHVRIHSYGRTCSMTSTNFRRGAKPPPRPPQPLKSQLPAGGRPPAVHTREPRGVGHQPLGNLRNDVSDRALVGHESKNFSSNQSSLSYRGFRKKPVESLSLKPMPPGTLLWGP